MDQVLSSTGLAAQVRLETRAERVRVGTRWASQENTKVLLDYPRIHDALNWYDRDAESEKRVPIVA
jgi:hypothetical protein